MTQLKITAAILDQFASQKREGYIKELLAFFRRQASPLFEHLTDTEATARIRAAVESAKAIGDISDAGLAKYSALCMLCGLEFIKSPDVSAFFNEPGRSFDVKVEWLINRVLAQLSEFGSTEKI